TGTPQSSGGRNWVYVDYDTGVDGWSTDGSLVKVGAATTAPSSSNSTPSSAPTADPLPAIATCPAGTIQVGSTNSIPPTPICASPAASSPTSIPTAGLVGYWNFDDGTAADNSNNGNNGTLVNIPSATAGKIGTGLSFNGANAYVRAEDSASLD